MPSRMQITAPNGGTIWFERDSQSAALRAAADLAFAATRAQASDDSSDDSSDTTTLVAAGDDPQPDPNSLLSKLQKNAPIVSAGAGLVNATAATSMLAINIANLIARKAEAGKTPNSLEIELTNASDSTMVVYAVNPNKADVTKLPQPIGKDASDILLITAPGGFDDNATSIAMSMLIMGIDVTLTFKLFSDSTTPARWDLSLVVAGADKQSFTPGTSLIGVTYTDSSAAFSLYTTGLTSVTGQIDVIVFDTQLDASALTPTPPPSGATLSFLTDAKTTGQLAAADLAALQTPPTTTTSGGTSTFIFPALIPIATAVFSTATAVANIGNLGFGVASLLGGDPKLSDTLELNITNNSTLPVVVAGVSSVRAQDVVVRMATPLGEGESDTLTLSNPAGFAKDISKGDGTKLTVSLIVGGLALALDYEWTSTGSPGRWKVSASSGGSEQKFDAVLQLIGVDYAATTGAFRLYTMPIETSTGQIDITIYDRSS